MDDALQSRVEVLAREIAGQARTIEDVNGLMRLMMKSALERMLDTEMGVHLGRRPPAEPAGQSTVAATPPTDSPTVEPQPSKKGPNRRNGRSKKTVRSESGQLTIATPRDRDGTFEPQLIEKYQRRVPGALVRRNSAVGL